MESTLICLDTSILIDFYRKKVPDILIAGTAMSHNLPLATLNRKHFERIKDLQLVDLDF